MLKRRHCSFDVNKVTQSATSLGGQSAVALSQVGDVYTKIAGHPKQANENGRKKMTFLKEDPAQASGSWYQLAHLATPKISCFEGFETTVIQRQRDV